jgi:hypothetical protein
MCLGHLPDERRHDEGRGGLLTGLAGVDVRSPGVAR